MYTGFLRVTPSLGMPDHGWVHEAIALRRTAQRTFVHGTVGFFAFYAGRRIHILDCNALGDPLLARLPVDKDWRIGHFGRRLPAGYYETIDTRRNVIVDSDLAFFYDRLTTITRGPVWSMRRFRTLLQMNLGRFDNLLNGHQVEPEIRPGCH